MINLNSLKSYLGTSEEKPSFKQLKTLISSSSVKLSSKESKSDISSSKTKETYSSITILFP